MPAATSPTPSDLGTPTPMGRGGVVVWAAIGIVAVSTAGVLARFAMGDDPGVVRSAPGAASALAIAFWRSTLGSLALAPVAWRHQRRQRRAGTALTRRQHQQLGLAGTALALHFALFQGALALTSVASAVTLTTMSPLFVALGGWLLLGERTTRRAWVGIAVTVLGALLIGLAHAGGDGQGSRALLGDAMALAAAVGATAYLLAGRKARQAVTVSTYGAIVYGWAGLLLLPVAWLSGAPLTGFTPTTWMAIAGIVVGPQLLGHTVFNLLLGTLKASTVSITILGEPVGAGLLAWALLAEVPEPLFAVGAPLVLVGVAVVIRGNADRRPAAPAGDSPPTGVD